MITPPQNLSVLAHQLEVIMDLFQQGQIVLIEKNLLNFFQSLQSFIHPDDLTRCVNIMSDATYLLEKKIDLLKSFFVTLSMKQNLIRFFESYSPSEQEHICMTLFSSVSSIPLSLPGCSMNSMQHAWNRLIDRKMVSHSKEIIPNDLESKIDPFTVDNLLSIDPPFEEQMLAFLRHIHPWLPNTLEVLLATDMDISAYFTHFLYLLHLVQQGYLVYDPHTKQFSWSHDDHE